MACVPCLVAPLLYGSSIVAFLNKNKIIVTISVIILIVSCYLYYKYRNCKKCKGKK